MTHNINFNLNVRSQVDQPTTEALARIERKLDTAIAMEKQAMADLTTLQAEVQRNTEVEKSALVLIQGLKDQIVAAGTDPEKLKAIVEQLTANDDALAAAVAANTPAA